MKERARESGEFRQLAEGGREMSVQSGMMLVGIPLAGKLSNGQAVANLIVLSD